MRGVIYKYTSPSGKVYIGQTLNEYMRRAMWKNINHPYAGPYINRARAKYGYSNFKYDVLISLESDDESFLREEINRLEKYYIELYNSTNPSKGYNITIGGLGHELKQNILYLKCIILKMVENTVERNLICIRLRKYVKGIEEYFQHI